MEIVRYEEAEPFLEVAGAFLFEQEVDGLLAMAMRIARERPASFAPYFALVRDAGEVQGAIGCPESGRLMVARAKSEAAAIALAEEVHALGLPIRELSGPEPSAGILARELAARSGKSARCLIQLHLHTIARVQRPDPIASGRLRLATLEDLPLIIPWVQDFHTLVHEDFDAAAHTRARVHAQSLFLWEDGVPVSMANKARKSPNGISVNLVYTPDALRGRGYATACVGTLTQALLDEGNRFVSLYTDVTNPISNAIYYKLGYRKIGDSGTYAIERPRT